MDRIEEIWESGNDSIAQDESLDTDAILKSISESSIGITAKLLKPIWFGMVIAAFACFLFIYNLFLYTANLSIVIPILVCLAASASVFIYLLLQIGVLRRMDTLDLSLHRLLVHKIKYLNTRFNTALHLVSLSIVLATFTINLTIESDDGIFEINKILILSAFYLLAYILTFGIFSLSHKVYDKQLKNALLNLEENTLRSMDEEMKRHRRTGRVILVIAAMLILSGIAALLFISSH